jgi:putative transcriptional regulator
MTAHHPELQLLSDYASGSMAIAEAICISAHLDQCVSCRQQIDTFNQLGGELLEAFISPSINVAPALLDKIFTEIDKPLVSPVSEETSNLKVNTESIPLLQNLVPNGYDSLRWRRLGSKLEIARLPSTDHSHELALYRIQPDGRIPEHGHHGSEMTTVLKGAFSDVTGIYTKGDFLYCDSDSVHRPIATQDGECLCLSAETAPIKFTGWPAKILNPILKLERLLSS